MRRLARILINAATALSALLALATATLWVRSYYVCDTMGVRVRQTSSRISTLQPAGVTFGEFFQPVLNNAGQTVFAAGLVVGGQARRGRRVPGIVGRLALRELTSNRRQLTTLAMRPIVQISLDIIDMDEALDTAEMAIRAGVDWLEAGTPMIIAHGMHGVRELRRRFGETPIVADLKTMDGGWLEAEMMAKAGATHVVVMARAHPETVKVVVKAGKDFGVKVMGDNLGCPDMVTGAMDLQDLGCDYVVHHIGYDERRGIAAMGKRMPSPLDQLREVVDAVSIPVQAVGGLTLEQAIRTPEYGAPLVVLGAPLTIDAEAFKTAGGDLESSLRLICEKVHGYGDVRVGR